MQTVTTPHPAHMFTVEQAKVFNDAIAAHLAERKKILEAPRVRKPLEPIVYADCYEAQRARADFEQQPDAEQTLSDAYDKQNELFEMESELLAIAKDIPHMDRVDADQARRKIFGYEVKRQPSLPGMLDEYVHVEGTLEKTRAKLADIDRNLPRLMDAAERYLHVKASLAPWPWVRINRERNAALEREAVLNGKPIQRRGPSMQGRSVEFNPV